MSNFQEKVSFIWDLADLLRGSYKRNEYQKVILPFTVLKRFDCVLSDSKEQVVAEYQKYKHQFQNLDNILSQKSKHSFYNYSKFDFKKLLEDPENIKENLIHYIDSFSSNVQDIFTNFDIKNHIERLSKANLLYLLMKKFSETTIDLHPDVVSNHEMGTIFEELIRRFSEQSNEEAGEHFTPRDVVKLMTRLMFIENGQNLKKKDIIRTIYDPACGTGGMLTSCKDFILEMNPSVTCLLFGQEINPEIYAICKSDILMKGDESDNIKGPMSTLSHDQFEGKTFNYIISNPPYGTKWEQDEQAVKKEAEYGFEGRFGAGLPRINDGQLLFLQHMISKMNKNKKSRIAVITNGSPLFTGDAGQAESDIRKWIIENDLLEAIIALPEQLFYNTGIRTYIWILTNQKPQERVGKIQLIDATANYKKMSRGLGDKRNYLSEEDDISEIVSLLEQFKENEKSKIFDNEDFGYTKVIAERSLQLNFQVTEERLENLYTVKAFSNLSESKNKNPELKLKEEEKGKIKQENIIHSLKDIGTELYKDWDKFEVVINRVLKDFRLSPSLIKNIILALSEHDNTANYVTDKKGKKQADSNLRDYEKIPLKQNIKEYFEKEVLPYYPDAWLDREKDKVGYEINFTRYFYKYSPPRPLEEIEQDIKKVIAEVQELIKEDL